MAQQRYRHQIVIQTPTESQNDFGEVTESWATLITCWASMESGPAGEAFEAGAIVQQNTYAFEIYYNSSVTTKCRIKYGTRYFDIQSVTDPDGRARKLAIVATETQEA